MTEVSPAPHDIIEHQAPTSTENRDPQVFHTAVGSSRFRLLRSQLESLTEAARNRFAVYHDPDTIPRPYFKREAMRDLRALDERSKDPKTGLLNEGALFEEMQREIDLYDRDPSGPPIEYSLADGDDYSQINDHFGHSEGDIVKEKIVDVLKSNTRGIDLVAIQGGDEFGIFSRRTTTQNRTSSSQVISLPDKIRESVKSNVKAGNRPMTISVGTADYIQGEGLTSFRSRAEDALIVAKWLGKDRTVKSVVIDGENYFYDLKEPQRLMRVEKKMVGKQLKVVDVISLEAETFLERLNGVGLNSDAINISQIAQRVKDVALPVGRKIQLHAVGGAVSKPLPRKDIDLVLSVKPFDHEREQIDRPGSTFFQKSEVYFNIVFMKQIDEIISGTPLTKVEVVPPQIDDNAPNSSAKHDGWVILKGPGGVPIQIKPNFQGVRINSTNDNPAILLKAA